ncbi:uncharacterized protein LOC134527529 isoform X2 [Bacillus rossius redtenbacheri]|uniref:uncharacterized protein LOC134527529 isoform X2 n=1 Tax=Bacillus rossius redtenbacheri TaxID=93214 RepID=UPI002FDDD1DF
MYIFEVSNKEDIKGIVVQNLRNLGIKHRIKKYDCATKNICQPGKVFGVSLVSLSTDAVFLNSGAIIEVPSLVLDACCRIRENIEMEGLFRKAGSSVRQKEIKALLEQGGHLQPHHNVIDVANILKMFFRDLPEPLVPYTFHDILLRCLLLEGKAVDTLLETCLLLPAPHLNVLAFLMEVLKEVAGHCATNKMDTYNIALIITPSVMPVDEKLARHFATRLECHVKVVELLIQHAEIIGMVPACARSYAVLARHSGSSDHSWHGDNSRKKKKKKRSSSLTRVLNGIKKMVGRGSPEEEGPPAVPVGAPVCSTPCVQSLKKRKAADGGGAFSSKKRRDVLCSLPQNVALASLPYTPSPCTARVLTFSAGGSAPRRTSSSRFVREVKVLTSVPVKDEPRGRKPDTVRRKRNSIERLWDKVKWHSSSDVPAAANSCNERELHSSSVSFCSLSESDSTASVNVCDFEKKQSTSNDAESDFVNIFKSEYEDIKNRVTAIESHIFQELGQATAANGRGICEPSVCLASPGISEGVNAESVQCEYEKMVEQSVKLDSSSTDQLARILGRELKIRHSLENKVIRSPSARKIGTIRRRSKENFRSEQASEGGTTLSRCSSLGQDASCRKPNTFEQQHSLRRGRPNSVHSGLSQCNGVRYINIENLGSDSQVDMRLGFEPGEHVSRQSPLPANDSSKKLEHSSRKDDIQAVDGGFHSDRGNSESWTEGCTYFREAGEGLGACHATGRPSVAWLRDANAGVVMARTRLFDGRSPCSTRTPTRQRTPAPRISPRKLGTLRRRTNKSPRSGGGSKSKRSPAHGVEEFKENLDLPQIVYGLSPNRQMVHSTFSDEKRVLKEKSPLKDSNAIKLRRKDAHPSEMPHIKKPLLMASPGCYGKTPQRQVGKVRNHTPLKATTPLSCTPRYFPKNK